MTNPSPGRITAQMWRLWTDVQPTIPGVRLGGIYADKSGYHNSRLRNLAKWPGTYSIRLTLDLAGPADKAAAIDYTLGDAEMRKRTGLLRASALDATDSRLSAVREFYGTLDGRTVYGLIKDTRSGPWRSSSADSTHLWHIHISVFRADVDTWPALAGIASVMSGESLAAWRARTAPESSSTTRRGTPKMLIVKVADDNRQWITDGVTRRHVPTLAAVRALEAIGVPRVEVATAAALDAVAGPVHGRASWWGRPADHIPLWGARKTAKNPEAQPGWVLASVGQWTEETRTAVDGLTALLRSVATRVDVDDAEIARIVDAMPRPATAEDIAQAVLDLLGGQGTDEAAQALVAAVGMDRAAAIAAGVAELVSAVAGEQ